MESLIVTQFDKSFSKTLIVRKITIVLLNTTFTDLSISTLLSPNFLYFITYLIGKVNKMLITLILLFTLNRMIFMMIMIWRSVTPDPRAIKLGRAHYWSQSHFYQKKHLVENEAEVKSELALVNGIDQTFQLLLRFVFALLPYFVFFLCTFGFKYFEWIFEHVYTTFMYRFNPSYFFNYWCCMRDCLFCW